MRSGDIRTIIIPAGEGDGGGDKVEAVYLGSGSYCRAFRVHDTVYCYCVGDEYMKDALTARWCNQVAHVPKVKYVGDLGPRRVKHWRVFSMPYYKPIAAAHQIAWPVLVHLKATAESLWPKYHTTGDKPLYTHGLYFCQEIIDKSEGKVPASVTRALQEMLCGASNYGGGIAMEFAKRNIGVDSKWRIVFRDILFDAEKLHRKTMKRFGAARILP